MKISDTISRLKAMKVNVPLAGAPGPDRLRDFDVAGSNPGGLRARAYIPSNLPAQAPLVVVLHGCTQTAAGYDHGSGWSTLADRYGFAVLFPEQQRFNNPNLCFNWFVSEDIRRDGGEAASIRRMIEQMVVDHALDRDRIFVTGLSAGGAMTSVMLAAYPEVFAGGAIIAGLPYGSATTLPQALDRMQGRNAGSDESLAALIRAASPHRGRWPTISIWHGSADHTVNPSNAEAIIGQWRGLHGVPVEPTRSETVDSYPHRVWCDSDGRAVIEDYSITGMGHGTPLDTTGAEAYGSAGPYMIEASISSTQRIAAFWGLIPADAGKEHGATVLPKEPVPALTGARLSAAPQENPAERPHLAGHPSGGGVQDIIENALRAAGLMK